MQKFLLVLFTMFFVSFSIGQIVLDNFDTSAADSIYELSTEGGDSYIEVTDDEADKVEGDAALYMKTVIGAHHGWGSYAQLIFDVDSVKNARDWTASDSLSIWIKVHSAPSIPDNFLFRIHLKDQLTDDGDSEEYIYENTTTVDQVGDWFELKVPLIERETDGTTKPNDEGFVLFPSDWGGGTYNNSKLDRDKITGWVIALVTSGWDPDANLPADSIEVSFDNFTRFGSRAVPFLFFTGRTLAGGITAEGWGGSSVSIEEGAGYTEDTPALKWVQGNEWNNGWSGITMSIDPAYNMIGSWGTDSLKFWMKADVGTGNIRAQFEDGAAKVGTVFDPMADGAWHYHAFKLSDMTYQDGTSNFDTTAVSNLVLMAEGNADWGREIYFDDLWTGNPDIDVSPPGAVENFVAVASPGNYFNIIGWSDFASEEGEQYFLYASPEPITDTEDLLVDFLGDYPEGEQGANHYLNYPLVDNAVSYYYAVKCMDSYGNMGPLTSYGPVENTAKGIATISLTPPLDFAADGDVLEWENSGIMPFNLSQSTAFISRGTFTDDADMSSTIYLAMDSDNFYIAVSNFEDDYTFDAEANWWDQDAFEVFIGLYDSHGSTHSSFERGDEPDYKIILKENGIAVEPTWVDLPESIDEVATYWFENWGGGEYAFEAKIPFDSLKYDEDYDFTPVRGMRIPLELTVHDNDFGTSEGNLVLSSTNTDNAHQTPSVWSYTWIGDTTAVATAIYNDKDPIVASFNLQQNYPNPFNPRTTIEYSIANASRVELAVYNVLGQKVKTLVNMRQTAGTHLINFEAADFASGVYFYKIQAGDFTQIKKMLLVK